MNETLQFLQAQWPWLQDVLLWVGACRFVFKWFSQWLRAALTRALQRASADDPAWVHELVTGRPYRTASLLIDLLCSVKLPREQDLKPQPLVIE